MQLTNIPAELRTLPQWVCADKDKLPKNPRTGNLASVADPGTWATFDEAVRAGKAHIGFVLTGWDEYTIIDLDNKPEKPATQEQWERQQKILNTFDSYTERSASGSGYHIIVKGRIPAGVHRDNVEVYSSGRYMICTGDVVRNAPIRNYQELLDILYKEMKPATSSVDLVESVETLSDEEIVDIASSASNGVKFNALCAGDMTGYPSQSEADFALLSILAFYTKSNEQVRRLFRMSALGKRPKAVRNDTYLDFAIGKIRAQQPPEIDGAALTANAEKLIAATHQKAEPLHASGTPVADWKLPPGFVGELAEYFYSSAIRPVREIALAAAIGCVAGVVGRSYNISGQGLAQYLILLAKTGTGKEALASGISRMFTAVRNQVPMATDFLGPAVFASGPALHRVLSEKPCFVSILGEFGYTVQRLSNPKANAAELTLKQLLLDAYGKSGFGQILQASVYSDREKNVTPVASPNITVLGESTPSSFYDGLDEGHIASGFLSRFLIIEYTGERPERNRNFNAPPPQRLVDQFRDLVTIALTTASNNTCAPVSMDAEGQAILDAFDAFADNHIRSSRESIREIWNRAHLKTLKLAGLVAVGVNPHSPVVTKEVATWCCQLVESDCLALQAKFSAGDIGTGDSKQMNEVQRVVENYFKLSLADAEKHGLPMSLLATRKYIPYMYIIRRTAGLASFRADKQGSTLALKRTIQAMVDSGMLVEINQAELLQKYQFSGKAFGIGSSWK